MKKLLFIFNPVAGKGAVTGKLYSIINTYFRAGYLVTAVPTARQDILKEILVSNMECDLIVYEDGVQNSYWLCACWFNK